MTAPNNALFASIGFSWAGAAASFVMHSGLGILCGLASLVASIYCICVSRARLKLLKRQLEDL